MAAGSGYPPTAICSPEVGAGLSPLNNVQKQVNSMRATHFHACVGGSSAGAAGGVGAFLNSSPALKPDHRIAIGSSGSRAEVPTLPATDTAKNSLEGTVAVGAGHPLIAHSGPEVLAGLDRGIDPAKTVKKEVLIGADAGDSSAAFGAAGFSRSKKRSREDLEFEELKAMAYD